MIKPMLCIVTFCLLLLGLKSLMQAEVAQDSPIPRIPLEHQASAGVNAFAFSLYQQLRENEGNVFFSPFSLSTALTMAYVGSAGTTEQALHSGLHLPGDRENALASMSELARRFQADQEDRPFELRIANSLWGQTGYPFHEDFLRILKDRFGSPLREVDYIQASREATAQINAWVEEQTHQRIKNLIPDGALNAQTRLVIANAIYFKGLWSSQFHKDQTKDHPFEVTPDHVVQVPMMYQRANMRYWENHLLQALEMSYQGDEVSALFLLPRQRHALESLERALSTELLEQIQANLSEREVEVRLPRFKIEAEYELARPLTALGMQEAFGVRADFSRMTSAEDLFISAVMHKAFVEVNEEGTEAAAATGVIMRALAMVEYPRFTADQPFLMLIQDKQVGTILFIGRVVAP